MKYTYYLGIAALIVAWGAIVIAIIINPWWNIMEGNLSQLGSSKVIHSYIYNWGLILSGILFAIFANSLIDSTKSRLGAFSAGIYFIASVHLMLVAIFASSDPHGFASGEFFLLTSVSIFFFGLVLVSDGFKKHGYLSILYFVLALVGSALIDFPSNALLEVI